MRPLCDSEISTQELAYLAGIIDGEGTISISTDNKPTGYSVFILRLTISNSNVDLINWCLDRVSFKIQEYNRGNPKWNTQYILTLQSQEAKELIKLVYPYLVVKKAQAEAALEFPLNGSRKYTNEERQDRQTICANLKTLNRRGKVT